MIQHTTSRISGWFLVYRRIGVLCRGTIIDSTCNQKNAAQMKPANSLPAFQHACLLNLCSRMSPWSAQGLGTAGLQHNYGWSSKSAIYSGLTPQVCRIWRTCLIGVNNLLLWARGLFFNHCWSWKFLGSLFVETTVIHLVGWSVLLTVGMKIVVNPWISNPFLEKSEPRSEICMQKKPGYTSSGYHYIKLSSKCVSLKLA